MGDSQRIMDLVDKKMLEADFTGTRMFMVTERGLRLKGVGFSFTCVHISMSDSGNKLWGVKQEVREGAGVESNAITGACLSFEQLVTAFSETKG